MTELLSDIWPILLTAAVGTIGVLVRYLYNLKERVAVLEKSMENLQRRMDSHSKKQDDILEKINSMDRELVKQMGAMAANISALSSDLKGLNNLLSITDVGIKINRQPAP